MALSWLLGSLFLLSGGGGGGGAFADDAQYVADPSATWGCHRYVGNQEATNWCASATFEGGFEYSFTVGGLDGPCSPCWCCKRKAAVKAEAPDAEEAMPEGPKGLVAAGGLWEAPQAKPQPQTPAEAVATKEKEKEEAEEKQVFVKHEVKLGGLQAPSALLVGNGGSTREDQVVMWHGDGLSVFSKYEEAWKPDDLAQLQVLGKMLSFTVDLSRVGCGCNLAFYLIASPARDWNGQPHPGKKRGGQPPYYCDANQVGGQWCPEIDIMEANTHAFAATVHKCEKPQNGYYSFCDRTGCSENTRDTPASYGVGEGFSIDTSKPFDVQTEFHEETSGVLTGMRTVLVQNGRMEVVMEHSGCSAEYLALMSDVLKTGMSLRITYWGDDATTMAWMDAPPCGKQACKGANAGHSIIHNITVGPIPKRPAPKTSSDYTWAVSDRKDKLFGEVVPRALVNDSTKFVSLGSRGVVQWKRGLHFVMRRSDSEKEVPEEATKDAKSGVSVSFIAKKYGESGDLEDRGAKLSPSVMAFSALLASSVVALMALGACRAQGGRVDHRMR